LVKTFFRKTGQGKISIEIAELIDDLKEAQVGKNGLKI
jgi:hypothetical protein